MFDNSRDENHAFSPVRAEKREELLYDCRDKRFEQDSDLPQVAKSELARRSPIIMWR
jgi:hypothetical protein